MDRVLIVDDKEMMRDSVSMTLTRAGYQTAVATDGRSALKSIADRRPTIVISDLQMPGMTGIELLKSVGQLDDALPVILMTAYATVQTAVDAMKQGAFDYIMKPFEGDQLLTTIARAVEHSRLLRENAVLRSRLEPVSKQNGVNHAQGAKGGGPILVGESAAIQRVREQISRIASSHGTVLVFGESGVGKEIVAQLVHALSQRSAAPMLSLNCAALSASLLESELFGHEKGAFTGADRLRKGRFELADGSTLLLDEISEIAPQIQAKLLRVLQEHAFERVGSSTTQKADVRIIATTNRQLTESVAKGDFRQDLYFRLNVLPIEVPPLRQRLDDVPLLAAHFLRAVAQRDGRSIRRFDDEAVTLLQTYQWPGNVRELQNICERASIFAADDLISASTIRPWLMPPQHTPLHAASRISINHALGMNAAAPSPAGNGSSVAAAGAEACESTNGGTGDVHHWVRPGSDAGCVSISIPPGSEDDNGRIPFEGRPLEDIERDVIVATLNRHHGHRQRTARELKIGIRTLGLKLRKWKELDLVSSDL